MTISVKYHIFFIPCWYTTDVELWLKGAGLTGQFSVYTQNDMFRLKEDWTSIDLDADNIEADVHGFFGSIIQVDAEMSMDLYGDMASRGRKVLREMAQSSFPSIVNGMLAKLPTSMDVGKLRIAYDVPSAPYFY